MPKFAITVNGDRREIDALADEPLLWVLRDRLGLTGAKYGCGEGYCGSCTVFLDGVPIRSCVTTIEEAEGRRVVTIEGLSEGVLHPVQRAWLEEQVPQCGYCQSGQILQAVALLENKPNPTDDDIDEAMSGVLCRCGTYGRIRRAIHRAAKEMNR